MARSMFSDPLVRYLDDRVPKREGELRAMEEEGRRTGFPIIGPACGHLAYLVARMIGARQIFEMGSGYGYSTAWFARAVLENGGGRVVHTVWDPDLSDEARRHLTAMGYAAIVDYRVAEAVEELRRTPGPFDLIFLDIDKEAYPDALDVIEERIRSGGVLLADNLLLGGSILDGRARSARVTAMRRFTDRVLNGDRWIGSIVPLRDGFLMAYRR
jgi:caffeoyl-CoA O-methyltransferase